MSGRSTVGRRAPALVLTALIAVVLILVVVMAIVIRNPGAGTSRTATSPTVVACPAVAPVKVGAIVVPAGPVAGYCQDRLVNAAHIINAARSFGIGTHTQAVGVMTAMGESGLQNLPHGDAAGADSRGLFQQRANGMWGTLADRMTPYIAAHNFFAALIRVPGWKTLSPTQAAHAVQINQDGNYYTQYWGAAVEVVSVLNG
ncbi:MAG TPA: hypothetical protein VGI56_06580 [Galbitalea sp.]